MTKLPIAVPLVLAFVRATPAAGAEATLEASGGLAFLGEQGGFPEATAALSLRLVLHADLTRDLRAIGGLGYRYQPYGGHFAHFDPGEPLGDPPGCRTGESASGGRQFYEAELGIRSVPRSPGPAPFVEVCMGGAAIAAERSAGDLFATFTAGVVWEIAPRLELRASGGMCVYFFDEYTVVPAMLGVAYTL